MLSLQAQINKFAEGTEKRLTKLMRRTLTEMMDMAQEPQPSVILTGGTFEVGKVPLLSEDLWSSLVTTINGAVPSKPGVKSYLWRISRMKIGDTITFEWTVPYARRIEFGFAGQDVLGRFYNVKGRLFATTAYHAVPGIFARLSKEV